MASWFSGLGLGIIVDFILAKWSRYSRCIRYVTAHGMLHVGRGNRNCPFHLHVLSSSFLSSPPCPSPGSSALPCITYLPIWTLSITVQPNSYQYYSHFLITYLQLNTVWCPLNDPHPTHHLSSFTIERKPQTLAVMACAWPILLQFDGDRDRDNRGVN